MILGFLVWFWGFLFWFFWGLFVCLFSVFFGFLSQPTNSLVCEDLNLVVKLNLRWPVLSKVVKKMEFVLNCWSLTIAHFAWTNDFWFDFRKHLRRSMLCFCGKSLFEILRNWGKDPCRPCVNSLGSWCFQAAGSPKQLPFNSSPCG